MVGGGVVLLGGSGQVSLPEWPDTQALQCGQIEIGPRYFETLQTPVLRGREFDRRDTSQSAPVAIVNESLARRFWPAGTVIASPVMLNRHRPQPAVIVKDVPLQTPRPP